ncbi:hypothetical protein ACRPLQ_08245 [Priestia sp. TRN 1309]
MNMNEVQEDDVIELFCPNCRIPNPISTYYTDDIIEHAETLVINQVMDLLTDFTIGFISNEKGGLK